MIFRNPRGLPEYVVTAIKQHFHRKADYSVSELISPPRQTQLRIRHDAEIEVDVYDQYDMWLGRSVHLALELANKGSERFEFEKYIEMSGSGPLGKVTISGTLDIYDRVWNAIDDVKLTKVWKAIYGGYDEYTAQLNLYAVLLHSVTKVYPDLIRNLLLFKDWSVWNQKRDKKGTYPKEKFLIVPQPLWGLQKGTKFLRDSVYLHERCKRLPDHDLPFCKDSEVWARGEGAKQVRPRCADYCVANKFCNQYQAWLKEAGREQKEEGKKAVGKKV